MTPLEIIALITQGAQLAQQGLTLISETREAISSEDEAALKLALAELQKANDAAYDRVQAKLAEAAKR